MKKHKLLSVVLAFLFLVFVAPWHVAKSDDVTTATADTIKTSVLDGIAFIQQSAEEGGVMLGSSALSTVELTAATYIVIHYYNPTDGAWPVYVKVVQGGNWIFLQEGTSYTVYDENFRFVENKQVQFNAIAPTPCSSGYIVLPASVFAGLATIDSFWITMPSTTAAGVEMHFGKVGYYTESAPDLAFDMHTLVDFSTWTADSFTAATMAGSGIARVIVKKGATGKFDGVQITQTDSSSYAEGGLLVNRFKTATVSSVDITNVQWFAFEYANLSSATAIGLIKMLPDANTAITVAAGSEIVFLDRNFANPQTVAANTYIYLNGNSSGWIVVPKSAFSGLENTLVATYLLMVMDASISGAALQYGKMLTYTEAEISDYTAGTVIADPGAWLDSDIAARTPSCAVTTTTRVQAPTHTVTKTVDGVSKTAVFDENATYVPTAPTKENAAFIGWKYTDASNTTGVVKTSSFTVTADCTVEALFVEFEKLGVSIKTAGMQGLRFKNQVKAESVALLEELGLTATYGTKLTHDTLGTQHIATENWLDVDNKVFAAVLTFNGVENVESYYDDVFTATAYVEINGVKYYANATQSASLAYVANLAVNDSNTNYSEAERSYLATIAAYYQA